VSAPFPRNVSCGSGGSRDALCLVVQKDIAACATPMRRLDAYNMRMSSGINGSLRTRTVVAA
jgi:hypothetical protein